MNIETGEVVDNSVNIHDAQVIGTTIITNMVGWSVFGYSYKRKDMVVNMNMRTIECEGGQASIDNQLLFQRLLAAASRNYVGIEFCLCFELNSQPASLFNKEGLVQEINQLLLKLYEKWLKCQYPLRQLVVICIC